MAAGILPAESGRHSAWAVMDRVSTPNPFIEDTTIFALINYSGAWNGGLLTYNTNELADGSRFMVGSQQWEIDYNRTSATGLDNFTSDYLPSSSFVAITAVPEPSTLVLECLGAALTCSATRNAVASRPRIRLRGNQTTRGDTRKRVRVFPGDFPNGSPFDPMVDGRVRGWIDFEGSMVPQRTLLQAPTTVASPHGVTAI